MRLLSQLGAHPSKLGLPSSPKLSAARSRSPAGNFSDQARTWLHGLLSNGSETGLSNGSSKRRPKLQILLVGLLTCLGCYFIALERNVRHGTDASSANQFRKAQLAAALAAANSNEQAAVSVSTVTDHHALDDSAPGPFRGEGIIAEAIPKPELDSSMPPLRVLPPEYPHPPLPADTAFGNPWPDQPNIVESFLSDEQILTPLPDQTPTWPVQHDSSLDPQASTWERKVSTLPKAAMVPWSKLYRHPSTPDVPYKLEELPKLSAAHRLWRQNTIQLTRYSETAQQQQVRQARQKWAKNAFLHAWRGYRSRAWGSDEVAPMSGQIKNVFNGWGATVIDSLSTLLIMGLNEEYSLARAHVRQIDFTKILGEGLLWGPRDNARTVPVFETIIRYLGGLLSAYDLSGGDVLMLERAEELAQWLLGAFNTRYGLPAARYQLDMPLTGDPVGKQFLAEMGSFSMEFGRLAQITGKSEYYDIVHRAYNFLETGFPQGDRPGSLLPTSVDDSKPSEYGDRYSFGAEADSFYEYLLKTSLLLRNSTAALRFSAMYTSAIVSAYDSGMIQPVEVVPGPENEDMMLLGQLKFGAYWPILEHLCCFAGGMLAMGARAMPDTHAKDLDLAARFTKTCFWAYNATASGLGPESMTFYHPHDDNRFVKGSDLDGTEFVQIAGRPPGQQRAERHSAGRPETIESIFYLWRTTGDQIWQERGWTMFTAWVSKTINNYGFTGLENVNSPRPNPTDRMESFVMAETLKYYYLLFSDPQVLSLDEFVFTTEAHPVRLPLPGYAAPKSFKPTWRVSGYDDEIMNTFASPYAKEASAVGVGTPMQMYLQMMYG